ncbi:MAG: ankyrin repeat domain-containing protein [Hyphomicrobiales bacterium]|nr:ankyrin repeat domain-containing protein [Hyphomicrobiales bacterium]
MKRSNQQLRRAVLLEAARSGHAHLVQRALLEDNNNALADIDDALIRAAANGHSAIVKMLTNAGANIHTRQDAAVWSAAANGHGEIVKLLEHEAARRDACRRTIRGI